MWARLDTHKKNKKETRIDCMTAWHIASQYERQCDGFEFLQSV